MINYTMDVQIVDEAGYEAALVGLGYNKKQDKNMTGVAAKLSKIDGGHNKFLESIYVWISVNAPRYWWQEADTHRISTKQSESTMHTLVKEMSNAIDIDAFENPEAINEQTVYALNEALKIEDPIKKLVLLKQLLPECFLQKRMWCMNYKTLRNIVLQRRSHRLPHWKKFCGAVIDQVKHPELLPSLIPGKTV